jgi:orotidine-5'-phosphate decarboxylase
MQPESPKLIVALDNLTVKEAASAVSELADAGIQWFKVGLELYTKTGPDFVKSLKARQLNVFLDLKLHDIPNTVGKAVAAAAETGADLLTVHCSGGVEMLKAAGQSAKGSSLAIVGVTVLTSHSDDDLARISQAWGVQRFQRNTAALSLAQMAAESGIAGIVCSVSDLRDGKMQDLKWSEKPCFITPGIRNSEDAKNDQKSTGTVQQAVAAGSTHLVVGRPILNPQKGTRVQAAKFFLEEAKHGI